MELFTHCINMLLGLLGLVVRLPLQLFRESSALVNTYLLASWVLLAFSYFLCESNSKSKYRISNGFLRNFLALAVAVAQVFIMWKLNKLHVGKFDIPLIDGLFQSIEICMGMHGNAAEPTMILLAEVFLLYGVPTFANLFQIVSNILWIFLGDIGSKAPTREDK